MKKMLYLEDENYIAIAKLIDNNFIGNRKIKVKKDRGNIYVIGHSEGGQCINCEVKLGFDISGNKINGVYTQNEDEHIEGRFRMVMPPTLKRVLDYLTANNFYWDKL